jgi:hypothetical protein
MSTQSPLLPAPLEAEMAKHDATDTLLNIGKANIAAKLRTRFEKLQAQHPAAVGLEIAITSCMLEEAKARESINKDMLRTAAANGMPIDGHVLTTSLRGDDVIVTATPDAEFRARKEAAS